MFLLNSLFKFNGFITIKTNMFIKVIISFLLKKNFFIDLVLHVILKLFIVMIFAKFGVVVCLTVCVHVDIIGGLAAANADSVRLLEFFFCLCNNCHQGFLKQFSLHNVLSLDPLQCVVSSGYWAEGVEKKVRIFLIDFNFLLSLHERGAGVTFLGNLLLHTFETVLVSVFLPDSFKPFFLVICAE